MSNNIFNFMIILNNKFMTKENDNIFIIKQVNLLDIDQNNKKFNQNVRIVECYWIIIINVKYVIQKSFIFKNKAQNHKIKQKNLNSS